MIKQTCALIAICLLVVVETEAGTGGNDKVPTVADEGNTAAPLSPEATFESLRNEHSAMFDGKDKKSKRREADLRMMLHTLRDDDCRDGYAIRNLDKYIEGDIEIKTKTRKEDVINLFAHRKNEMLLKCRPELLKKLEAGVEKFSAMKAEMKGKLTGRSKKSPQVLSQ